MDFNMKRKPIEISDIRLKVFYTDHWSLAHQHHVKALMKIYSNINALGHNGGREEYFLGVF